tara:strand:+ start:467 stop:1018 length:552 start_codon:yes stop_codon:yes gene_type:complete
MKLSNIIIFLAMIFSCNTINQPKPKGYLALNYPKSNYNQFLKQKFPFSFEYNNIAKVEEIAEFGYKVLYPDMKATIYLNYYKVNQNLDSLLNDAYKLPYKHIVKAIEIPEKIFINKKEKVYGTLFSVVGNAASQFQFFLTDSSNNFLVGSLYFYSKPNYDSLYPAIKYIEKDIFHLFNTLKWK